MKIFRFGNDYAAQSAKSIRERVEAPVIQNPTLEAIKNVVAQEDAGDQVHEGPEEDLGAEAEEGEEDILLPEEAEAEEPKKGWRKKNHKKGKR